MTTTESPIPPGISRVSTANDSYFLVRMRGGNIEALGRSSAEVGHRLSSTIYPVADGVFASWHWDGTRLVVENDRYGFYPLFWSNVAGGGVCISPSITRLIDLGISTELDLEALAVFFRLGYFVGDDTPFAAIKVVPPNAVFKWEDGNLECHGRYPRIAKAASITRDDAIDQYIALFAQAMAKRAPATNNFAVPISGGRDSRHILLELHRTGFQPAVCVSANDNPPDPNVDPEIGALLCAKLGWRHVVVDQQLSILAAQLRKNRETHFCASAHGWYLTLADFLNQKYDCIYDGIAGDVLSQSSFLEIRLDAVFHSRDVHAICTGLLSRHGTSQSTLTSVLKGPLKEALTPEIATARLSREVEKHLDAPNPIASFIFWNRTRREIALAPYGLLQGIRRVYAPFLDHNLFDFMATLPGNMLMDRTFHDDAIARAYPKFKQVPYADNKGAPRTDDTLVRARFLSEMGREFLLRRPSSLMKNMAPRAKILAGILSQGHINPSIPPLIIYLDQIESISSRRHKNDQAQ